MIEILATGGLSTVQDAGRFGYRHLGVGIAGAADRLAAKIGNAMLGNGDDAAFIEVLVFPFRARFHTDCRIAVTGADARATLDGKPIWPWWCLPVSAGQVLSFEYPNTGSAAYLCVSGGLDVAPILGSRSTDLKAGFGGLEGRALRRGDRLQALPPAVGAPDAPSRKFGVVPPSVSLAFGAPAEPGVTWARVLPAAEWDDFGKPAQADFLASVWVINPSSNRIGSRLDGPILPIERPRELLSHGIVPGVVQVPPAGQPIVMQCDAQTSGGYPKIATVIEADQWRVAQTSVGGRLRFISVTVADARDALAAELGYVDRIRRAAAMAC